jgi:hypothetical protein
MNEGRKERRMGGVREGRREGRREKRRGKYIGKRIPYLGKQH